MSVEDTEALLDPPVRGNACSLLTSAFVGPKKKQEKMSVGDFLADQCERIFLYCRLLNSTLFPIGTPLFPNRTRTLRHWEGLMESENGHRHDAKIISLPHTQISSPCIECAY
jgi:hypothetical protein